MKFQAITTKFLPPTNHRGSRIKATAQATGGTSMVMPIGTKVRVVSALPTSGPGIRIGDLAHVRSYLPLPKAGRNSPATTRYLIALSLTAEIPKDEVITSFVDFPGMAWVDSDLIEEIKA